MLLCQFECSKSSNKCTYKSLFFWANLLESFLQRNMQLQCNRVLLGVEVLYHQKQSKGDNQSKLQNLTNKMHIQAIYYSQKAFSKVSLAVSSWSKLLILICFFIIFSYCLIKYVIALEAHQIRFFSDKNPYYDGWLE